MGFEAWAVRILAEDGTAVAGAGLYLGNGLVLTCAHVVNSTLGKDRTAQDFPQRPVMVDFLAAPSEPITATVLRDGWWPIQDDERGDAAVLRLTGPIPASAASAPLGQEWRSETPVTVFGFPGGVEHGLHATASLAGQTPGPGWVQLKNNGPEDARIQRGFSGAGVVNTYTGMVIGIVVSARKSVSWLLPVREMSQRLPSVAAALRMTGATAGPAIGGQLGECRLPGDIADFTGRQREVQQMLHELAEASGGPMVRAISGMPGVGKTTLAVHLAHRLAPRFPDGQFYLDLKTHSGEEGTAQLTPEEALQTLLRALGQSQNAQEAARLGEFWRLALSRSRFLVVLDNAASYVHIKELLPDTPGSLILITSRRRLDELGARGIVPLHLEGFDEADSIELFTSIVGQDRAEAEPGEVREIMRLCGHLPLAIRLRASFAAGRKWTLSQVREDMGNEKQRLDRLGMGNTSVRAAFASSYKHLKPSEKRLFRRLGIHPPGILSMLAAAAVVDVPQVKAEKSVQELLAESLLRDEGPGRVSMHDLLREYARECLAKGEPRAEQRKDVAARLLDFYLGAALAAHRELLPQRPIADRPERACPVLPDVASPWAARSWFQQEQPNLIACSGLAAEYDQVSYLWRIPRALGHYLGLTGATQDATESYAIGLSWANLRRDGQAMADMNARLADVNHITANHAAAVSGYQSARVTYQRIGDRVSAADMLNRTSATQRVTNDYVGAQETAEQALAEFTELGDAFGQAEAEHMLGLIKRITEPFNEALAHHRRSIDLYGQVNYPLGQGRCLANIGVIHRLQGDYKLAAVVLREAELRYRDAGDLRGVANTVNNLASALAQAGRVEEGLRIHPEALDLYRRMGNYGGLADGLLVHADLHSKMGDHRRAESALREALEIYGESQAQLGKARAHLLLSMALRGQKTPDRALPEAEESLRLYRTLEHRRGQNQAEQEIAECRAAGADGS